MGRAILAAEMHHETEATREAVLKMFWGGMVGMISKCPYCGGEFEVVVDFQSALSDEDRYVLKEIMRAACGFKPHKGYVKPVEDEPYVFKFYLQIYDSPEGDVWIEGKARWVPQYEFKVLERRYV